MVGDEFFDGDDLCCYAGFGVDGSTAPDGVAEDLVGVEGGHGVEVGG